MASSLSSSDHDPTDLRQKVYNDLLAWLRVKSFGDSVTGYAPNSRPIGLRNSGNMNPDTSLSLEGFDDVAFSDAFERGSAIRRPNIWDSVTGYAPNSRPIGLSSSSGNMNPYTTQSLEGFDDVANSTAFEIYSSISRAGLRLPPLTGSAANGHGTGNSNRDYIENFHMDQLAQLRAALHAIEAFKESLLEHFDNLDVLDMPNLETTRDTQATDSSYDFLRGLVVDAFSAAFRGGSTIISAALEGINAVASLAISPGALQGFNASASFSLGASATISYAPQCCNAAASSAAAPPGGSGTVNATAGGSHIKRFLLIGIIVFLFLAYVFSGFSHHQVSIEGSLGLQGPSLKFTLHPNGNN